MKRYEPNSSSISCMPRKFDHSPSYVDAEGARKVAKATLLCSAFRKLDEICLQDFFRSAEFLCALPLLSRPFAFVIQSPDRAVYVVYPILPSVSGSFLDVYIPL